MLKIITLNANGIRAAIRKGFYDWLALQQADIICLQELKAQTHQIPLPCGDYRTYFHTAEKKGYSGVGIYCKKTPLTIRYGFAEAFGGDWSEFDREGRYIQVDYDSLSVASLYMPSGTSGNIRQQYKFSLMQRLQPRLESMARSDRRWIICGDWNIAHRKIDIKNWRGNQKNSGFLPEERQWMDWLFGVKDSETSYDNGGFCDAFRCVNHQAEQYSWWSNRGQAWANNTGWRIDYQVISRSLANTVIAGSEQHYTAQRFSDHAPLIISYDV